MKRLDWLKIAIEIDTDDCIEWPWTTKNRHIRLEYCGQARRAHSVALELATGESPNGRYALHSCDNPICINPKHLRWGTGKDNHDDMVERGRRAPRTRSVWTPKSKLTEDDVRTIRKLRADGLPLTEIGKTYGIDPSTVSRIARKIDWSHVED